MLLWPVHIQRTSLSSLLVLWTWLAALLVLPVSGVWSEEAGIVDWHRKQIGVPLEHCTFFHRPPGASGALLYTGTDRGILAALNLRSGEIKWRQMLGSFNTVLALQDCIVTLSDDSPSSIRAWLGQSGHLEWQTPNFAEEAIAFTGVSKGSEIVVLYKNSIIRKFEAGKLLWESRIDVGSSDPFDIALSSGKLFLIALKNSQSLQVHQIDISNGNLIDSISLNSNVTDLSYIMHSRGYDKSLLVWYDGKANGNIVANVIGSKSVIDLETKASPDFDVKMSRDSVSDDVVITIKTSEKHMWAYIYRIQGFELKHSYTIPDIKAPSAIGVSSSGDNVYLTKVTLHRGTHNTFVEITGVDQHYVLDKWEVSLEDSFSKISFIVSEVVQREDRSYAARSVVVMDDGTIKHLRNSEVIWTREEALASTESAVLVDLLVKRDDIDGFASSRSNLLFAYIHRLFRHFIMLKSFPSYAINFVSRFVTGDYDAVDTSHLEGDPFGFRKVVVAYTKNSVAYGMDTANQGKVVWRRDLYNDLGDYDFSAMFSVNLEEEQIVVIISEHLPDGVVRIIGLDPLNGKILQKADVKGPFRAAFIVETSAFDQRLVVVGEYVNTFPEPGGSAKYSDEYGLGPKIFAFRDGNAVLGHKLNLDRHTSSAVWLFTPPQGEDISAISSNNPFDEVASLGRVMPDRSVSYKYILGSLAAIATVDKSRNRLSVYFLDLSSGRIVHRIEHENVETSYPVKLELSENWVAYHYRSNEAPQNYILSVAELFDSSEKNVRWSEMPAGYRKNHTTPHILHQSFTYPHRVNCMKTTRTTRGITVKDLVLALESGSIERIPRHLLDPRRPIGDAKETKKAAQALGLIPYEALLERDTKMTLSHGENVQGVERLEVSPALLESTSVILGYGLDLFGTRVSPSSEWDRLGYHFSKIGLVVTIVALAAALMIVRPIVCGNLFCIFFFSNHRSTNDKWQNSGHKGWAIHKSVQIVKI